MSDLQFKDKRQLPDALDGMRFTREQAIFLRDLIGGTEAQLAVLVDALYTLQGMLADNEHSLRAVYLMTVAQELRTRVANARIAAGRYAEQASDAYRIEPMH